MKNPFRRDLTILSIPTKWETPPPKSMVIECPCCSKSYDMNGLIPAFCARATVTCSWCEEAMEVHVDRRGNILALWRKKSFV